MAMRTRAPLDRVEMTKLPTFSTVTSNSGWAARRAWRTAAKPAAIPAAIRPNARGGSASRRLSRSRP